jgi:hypothetical protein
MGTSPLSTGAVAAGSTVPEEVLSVCPRCGFTVLVSNDKLGRMFEDHVADCTSAPTREQVRSLRAEVKKARFLYGAEAGDRAALDGLRKIQGAE